MVHMGLDGSQNDDRHYLRFGVRHIIVESHMEKTCNMKRTLRVCQGLYRGDVTHGAWVKITLNNYQYHVQIYLRVP